MSKKTNYCKILACIIAGFLAILIFIVILVKAIGRNDHPNARRTAITVDTTDIPLNELNYYVVSNMIEFSPYETSYKQRGYDIWQSTYNNDMTIADYVLQTSIDTAVETNILCMEAKQAGISLTNEESEKAKKEAADYYEALSIGMRENFFLRKAVLETVYQKKALAQKYKDQIISDADIDEAAITDSVSLKDLHQFKYEYLLFPFGDPQNQSDDVENFISDEDKANGLKLMNEIHDMLPKVPDLKGIALEKQVVIYNTSTVLIGDGSIEPIFEDNLLGLNLDEYSDVFETKAGYVIAHKTGDTSKRAYLDAVNKKISDAKDTAFKKIYEPMLTKHKVIKKDDTINTITIRNF